MTENYRAWALGLNAEPWSMGKPSMIFNPKTKKYFPKYSPSPSLKQYQNAVREELLAQGAEVEPGLYKLRFTFSRQLEKAMGRDFTLTSNNADVTNMQKATEDALQGVAIGNDSAVIDVGGRMAGPQTVSAVPWVVIEVWSGLESYKLDPPLGGHAQAKLEEVFREFMNPTITDNTWEP